MPVSVLMELDHLTDRLLCVNATDVILHVAQLEKAKELIRLVTPQLKADASVAPIAAGVLDMARNVMIKQVAVSLKDEVIVDSFGIVDGGNMKPYYDKWVMFGKVQVYYDVSACTGGFNLRVTRGFWNKRHVTFVSTKLTDGDNGRGVLSILKDCMIY
jgi:hypothetical protein